MYYSHFKCDFMLEIPRRLQIKPFNNLQVSVNLTLQTDFIRLS